MMVWNRGNLFGTGDANGIERSEEKREKRKERSKVKKCRTKKTKRKWTFGSCLELEKRSPQYRKRRK